MMFLFAACLVATAVAVPSPKSLGSDLTFLFQNNLNWTEYAQHQGAILLSARNSTEAESACAQLGETLLVPNSNFFTSDFAQSLAYLVYTGKHSFLQNYWIAASNATCRALGPFGAVLPENCTSDLPVLCSQSAPFHIPANSTTPADWVLNPPIFPAWNLTVESKGLSVSGTRDQQSFRFLGIPYANTPERFTYSTLYSRSSTIDATALRSQCVQVGAFGGGSEDCLFLNIFTPYLPHSANPPKSSLKPVLFWIHGGGFTGGMGSDATFDGGSLASRGDVVVVTINYRLSTLGYLALNDGVTNGSYGISDQVTALEWVQKYITAFGGDPERVTISGQSAGAASVRVLLGSPKAIGKFAGAILQSDPAGSGSAASSTVYYTISQEVEVASNAIVNATGCSSANNSAVLACLRAYDPIALVNLTTVENSPVADGTYVTTTELPLNGSAPVANVHLMMGGMRDDGGALTGYPTSANLAQAIMNTTGYDDSTVSSLLASGLFPEPQGANGTSDVFNVTARLATDTLFRCLDQATAVAAVKRKLFKSLWYYQFNRSYQLNWWDPNAPACDAPKDAAHPYGDPSQEYFHCHSGELYLIFGTLSRVALPFRDADDLPFYQQVVDHWTSFMRTYDPNPDPVYLAVRGYTSTLEAMVQEGSWMPMTDAADATLRLLSVPSSQGGFNDVSQCDFLNYTLSYFG